MITHFDLSSYITKTETNMFELAAVESSEIESENGVEFPHFQENHHRVHRHSSNSPGGGDSSEEELTVLPRHTKVVVTGNNRTKSVLVGLHGVVKKAVGLGGWHWLVLTNGVEVKLQRNALTVIDFPTSNEEDDELECETTHCYGSEMTFDDSRKSQRSRHRVSKYSGLSQKTISRSLSCDSQTNGSSVTTPRRSTVYVHFLPRTGRVLCSD